MSVTLNTIADALIEFILSLLRDPEAAAEFDQDPEGALAARGLSNATAADVCGVAPVVAERDHVVPLPAPKPHPVEHSHPVVKEIKEITNSLTYVNNQNTVVDQSVNQNIWAGGDVNQIFDNEANVATGDDSIAAGDDVNQETNVDQSTDITAGDDVLVGGSENTETTNENSGNTTTETETNTETNTDTTIVDSGNTTTETETADDSYNDTAVDYTEQNVDSDTDVVFDSSDVVIEDTTTDDNF